ncbi:MAG: hypothetical protein ACRDXX_12135 [Stackebrandtia sp.]
MGFTETLNEHADEVLKWAVRRLLEEEDYAVEWDGDDHQRDEWWHVFSDDLKELTLDRYNSGPQHTGGKGGQTDNNSEYVAMQGGEVWNHLLSEYSWAKDAILEFGKASPSTTHALRNEMKGTALHLCADRSWSNAIDGSEPLDHDFGGEIPGSDLMLENAIKEMEYWDGQFATSFILTFGNSVEKWTEIVQGNFYLAALLTDSLDAQTAVVVAARKDVVGICDATVAALKGLEESSGPATSRLLTIAGAIIGVTLTVASAGTAAAVVAAAFAVTSAVVAEAEASGEADVEGQGSDEKYSVSGEDAFWVLNSMTLELGTVTDRIGEKEGEIKDGLWEAYNAVLSNRDKYEIQIESSPEQIGDRQTGAETETLATVAETDFPAAAEPLLTANEELAGTGAESGAFASETYDCETVVQAPWQAVRDLLMDLTATNGNVVKHTGETLLAYADQVGVVDGNAADDQRNAYKDLTGEKSGREHEPYEEPDIPPGAYRGYY